MIVCIKIKNKNNVNKSVILLENYLNTCLGSGHFYIISTTIHGGLVWFVVVER